MTVPTLARILCAALLLAACDSSTSPGGDPGICVADPPVPLASVPAEGAEATLDVVAWNIEWFGDSRNGFGPADEGLQLSNARDVISGVDADVWGVQEIVSLEHWNALEASLPGYSGFLASESNVAGGASYYSPSEQKVGILFKPSVASVTGARVILTASNADFGGRPPLEVGMRITVDGATREIVVIVLHAKASSDAASWQQRVNGAAALKAYLDATYPTQRVLVIGDFNDDIDVSIDPSRPSPYREFVADSARYRFTTAALSATPGVSSTVDWPEVIDHHLATNEMFAAFVPGSAKVLRPDRHVPSYASTTSDHYPVLTRYALGPAGAPASVTLTAPNGGESYEGGSVRDVTWTSSGVATVRIEYTTDGGGTWRTAIARTSAAAGRYVWTVPNVGTTAARVRVSDVASAASDASDAPFTIVARAGGTARVFVNELLPRPRPGDVTEFVELLNTGTVPVDVGGWTLSDRAAVRHVVPEGTVLGPGRALVVFGEGVAPAGVGTSASSGTLDLSDDGDEVMLRDRAGNALDVLSYTAAGAVAGVSLNRSPDGLAAAPFVPHTRLGACRASPGLRAAGTSF